MTDKQFKQVMQAIAEINSKLDGLVTHENDFDDEWQDDEY